MSKIPIRNRWAPLVVAALTAVVMLVGAPAARAQEVVALVDGIPITALDIEKRTKLLTMSSPKPVTRQEVLDGLIDETLEVIEAKKFSIDVPDSAVDNSYSGVAKRLGVDTDRLTQMLDKGGAGAATLRHRLRAQLAWDALVRGRYKSSLQIADSDVEAELQLHKPDAKDTNVGYEYTMRPIVFIVPTGSPDAAYEARKRDADALRSRFANCADGIPFARALDGVAVRDQVMKFSADLPQESRKLLDGIDVGHLTPPETTAEGVQMFAICAKQETKNDTPAERAIRDEIFQKKFGAQAQHYLEKLRREAMIEYK
jgi:peptidyl-prolyl cis-trans isomerase SurA